MSNRELFRIWAEAYTTATTAAAIGVDYLQSVVQTSGKGDPSWILTWTADFHSFLIGDEIRVLSFAYLPNSPGDYSIHKIAKAEDSFWKRVGHRRGSFAAEARRFKRSMR